MIPRPTGTILLALLTLACGGGDEPPRNVLLVSLDTVRADHIGCYGREDAGTDKGWGFAAAGAHKDHHWLSADRLVMGQDTNTVQLFLNTDGR